MLNKYSFFMSFFKKNNCNFDVIEGFGLVWVEGNVECIFCMIMENFLFLIRYWCCGKINLINDVKMDFIYVMVYSRFNFVYLVLLKGLIKV